MATEQDHAVLDILYRSSYALKAQAGEKWAEADRICDLALKLYELGKITEEEFYDLLEQSRTIQEEAAETEKAYSLAWDLENQLKAQAIGAN